MDKTINVINNTSGVGQTSFGVGHITLNLMRAQRKLGLDAKVWCVATAEDVRWAMTANDLPEDSIINFPSKGPDRLSYSPAMLTAAATIGFKADIIHQHGIWAAVSLATLKMHKNSKIPSVIAPHGSLSDWALSTSKLKKRIALAAYERKNLSSASCLHATSENEIADFRNFGLTSPIAFIDNGMQEKELNTHGNAARFFAQNGVDPGKRVLFFISRISPKKGLLMLVEAIHKLQDDFADWQLIIAGMDEFNHAVEVQLSINERNLQDKIKIIGPLFDQAKTDAFAAAELFVLPSYSEGSPMVVLESLAAGVPVVTTKASTWDNLITYNCGWWTEIDIKAIADALQSALKMTVGDLRKMGENGRDLISSRFTWEHSAKRTLKLYNWLLGTDDKPDFVLLK